MLDLNVTPPAFQINLDPSFSEVFKWASLTEDCQVGQLLISVKRDQTLVAGTFILIFCLAIMGAFVLILIFILLLCDFTKVMYKEQKSLFKGCVRPWLCEGWVFCVRLEIVECELVFNIAKLLFTILDLNFRNFL